MNLSREGEYAIKGMLALAGVSPRRALMLHEVAAQNSLPPGFLSKIFQKLSRHGLVQSHRGVGRGYTLARPAAEVTVRQILEAIEGPDLFDRCMFARQPCGEGTQCPLHPYWSRARREIAEMYDRVTLADLTHAGQRSPEAMPPPQGAPEEPAWIPTKVRVLYS